MITAAAHLLAPRRRAALAVALLALVSTWHGVNVQRQIQAVGRVQSVFTPQLSALAAQDTQEPLRLRPPESERWIFERLTTDVPGYRGVAYLRHPVLVGEGETAGHDIAPDGNITPVAP